MEKHPYFYCLILLVLCCFLIPPVAALSVDSIAQDPVGALISGEEATVEVTIRYTMDSSAELMEFFTDLQDAKWVFTPTRNGEGVPYATRYGHYEYLTGWDLYYPSAVVTRISLTLTGIVPPSSSAQQGVLLRVTQYDADGSTLVEEIQETALFAPLGDLATTADEQRAALAILETAILEEKAGGVNTSAVDGMVAQIAALIEGAGSGLMTNGDALRALIDAGSLIGQATALLTEESAGSQITDANAALSSLQALAAEVVADSQYDGDPRVWSISSYADSASTLLILAGEKETSGDYAAAGNYAALAQEKINDGLACYGDLTGSTPVPVATATYSATASATSVSGTATATTMSPTPTSSGISSESEIAGVLQEEVSLDSFLHILGVLGDGLGNLTEMLGSLFSLVQN